MTRDEIIRMAWQAFSDPSKEDAWRNGFWTVTQEELDDFAALVAAAKQEQIARQWDALHEQYMTDPLRRQMMLSYEMVARMIRGRT